MHFLDASFFAWAFLLYLKADVGHKYPIQYELIWNCLFEEHVWSTEVFYLEPSPFYDFTIHTWLLFLILIQKQILLILELLWKNAHGISPHPVHILTIILQLLSKPNESKPIYSTSRSPIWFIWRMSTLQGSWRKNVDSRDFIPQQLRLIMVTTSKN